MLVPWLKIQEEPKPSKRSITISIPRRVVRLSTKRARIRRLIKEVVRLDRVQAPSGKAYHFIVRRPAPSGVSLAEVRKIIQKGL